MLFFEVDEGAKGYISISRDPILGHLVMNMEAEDAEAFEIFAGEVKLMPPEEPFYIEA